MVKHNYLVRDEVPFRTDGYVYSVFREGCVGGHRYRRVLHQSDAAPTGAWGKNYRGLGFVLTIECGLTCLDLDGVVKEDGTLVAWASGLLAKLPATWCEPSPSGRGLHVWLRGTFTGKRNKSEPLPGGGRLEMYCTARYITVSLLVTPPIPGA